MALVAGVFLLHGLVPPLPDHDHPSAAHLFFWLVELPLAMLALSMTYRWSIQRRLGWVLTLLMTLVVSMVLASLTMTVTTFVLSRLPGSSSALLMSGGAPSYPFALIIGLVQGVVQCGIWALAFVYPFAAEESRFRALEAEKLRGWAELTRLRSQLEPHFLLNTLNAIAGLVTQNPREARRLLACLGDLLSDALRESDELQTVDREVSWLRRYTEILESRHAGALSFRWEIAHGIGSALIPRLLLQPLVENAVQHGALSRGSGGQVVVTITRKTRPSGERLVCSVEDNGHGTGDAPPRSDAFGLHAVRRRLELKYHDASLRLQSSADGTRAVVEVPLTLLPDQPVPTTRPVLLRKPS